LCLAMGSPHDISGAAMSMHGQRYDLEGVDALGRGATEKACANCWPTSLAKEKSSARRKPSSGAMCLRCDALKDNA